MVTSEFEAVTSTCSYGADLHRSILSTDCADGQVDVMDRERCEALGRKNGVVALARRNLGKAIKADPIRGCRELHSRGLVFESDVCVGTAAPERHSRRRPYRKGFARGRPAGM